MRDQGISWAKIKYIKDLAQKVVDHEVDLVQIETLSDEEVIIALTKVKGIGRWTAEMFLMFALARPDIFSTGDLGLKRAIQKLYGLKVEPDEKKLLQLSKKWSPYRTYAARILWRTLDQKNPA
jgi:DNA-3-methyladenine glycosylase II